MRKGRGDIAKSRGISSTSVNVGDQLSYKACAFRRSHLSGTQYFSVSVTTTLNEILEMYRAKSLQANFSIGEN